MSDDPWEFHVDRGAPPKQDERLPAADIRRGFAKESENFMTFTEAAVEVLKREGKPLHFRKIAEIAIRENLLDHVGKIPEETMAGQLSAVCRLPRPDRAIVVVQHATFALEEWGLPEDGAGLEGLVEPPPADEPPYRPRERHPIPARELARASGRDAARGRRREEGDEKRRRFPPPAEVAYEILSGAERPLPLRELAALGAERMLMPDAFVRDAGSLAAALREDNRRRESAGRKPLFTIEGDTVALGAAPEPGERPAVGVAVRAAPASASEMRRAALVALRRRLRECDGATVELLVSRLLEQTGVRELKVAKRGRDSVVLTGRRRMGLVDVRHAFRVLRNGADVTRRDVVDARRDLGHYGAQIGVLVTAGEAQREARGEAGAAGQLPVLLVAGEAFAEAFADAGVGCRIVAIPEADEGYLAAAAETAQKDEEARLARREERERREGRDGREGREDRGGREGRDRSRRDDRRPRPEGGTEAAEGAAPAQPVEEGAAGQPETVAPAPEADAAATEAGPVPVVTAPEPRGAQPPESDADDGDDEGDEDEGPEASGEGAPVEGAAAEPGKEGAPGEGRRRRRRRRRRGGRGRGERRADGAPATDGGGSGGGAPPPSSPPPGDGPPQGGGGSQAG